MSRYRKEIDAITKVLDLQQNKPMTYDELRKALFYIKENTFLMVLSDMFAEGLLVSDGDKYQLPPIMYAENLAKAQQKRQAIMDANQRLGQIKGCFNQAYYSLDSAQAKYMELIGSNDVTHFTTDMKAIGYNVTNNYILFAFTSIGEYITSELLKFDVVNLATFVQQYAPLVQEIDLSYWIEKLKQSYQLIEFEPGTYLNIKQLNAMNIYISDIHSYCESVYKTCQAGGCFTIKSLQHDGFTHPLDDLGMDACFYENLLRYDTRFLCYKMTHCFVFSTSKKPSIAHIVYDIVKAKRIINIYDLQSMLHQQFGVATSVISESGNLINQNLLFFENSTLYYSKEFESIYFDKSDYYKEIEYNE